MEAVKAVTSATLGHVVLLLKRTRDDDLEVQKKLDQNRYEVGWQCLKFACGDVK